MATRHTWRTLLAVLLLLIVLGAAVSFSISRLLSREGIQITTWQGLHINTNGLGLRALGLSSPAVTLEFEQVQLPWRGLSLSLPLWQQVEIKAAHITLPTTSRTEPATAPGVWQLQQVPALLSQLPQQFKLEQLRLHMPCAQGMCLLSGELLLERSEDAEQFELSFNQPTEALSWDLLLHSRANVLQGQLQLRHNQQPLLQAHSSATQLNTALQWQGRLSADLKHSQSLQDFLSQWLPAGQLELSSPDAGQVHADWQINLPGQGLTQAQVGQASGNLNARAYLSQPWPLPGVGQLQGNLALVLHAEAGNWLADNLFADLQLYAIDPSLLTVLPASLHPDSLHLVLRPSDYSATDDRALPLQLELRSLGPAQLQLKADLLLAKQPPWTLQLDNALLTGTTPASQIDTWAIGASEAQLHFSATLNPEQLSVQLHAGSNLSIRTLQQQQWHASQVHLSSDSLKLSASLAQLSLSDWHVSGPLHLSAQPEHPQLLPQLWSLRSQLDAQASQQQLSGGLSNAAGLALNFKATHGAQGLIAQGQLEEIFLRGGNPLANSFSAWPKMLELDNGRVNAQFDLRLAATQSLPTLDLSVQGKGLSGIYERTQLSGLDTQAQWHSDAKRLQLTLKDLRLEQANPGISLGPLQLQGQYSAPLEAPGSGQLTVQQAVSTVLGGTLRLPNNTWDLAQPTVHVPVQLQGLQLEQLFAQYPAEGLAGSGIIDGALVLQLDSVGLSIHDGQLQSRQPGYLQFRSEKIRALGRSNPAMQLVTQSLDDFHFTSLSSRVNYAAQGQLDLAIRLQGQNPAIEQGRPINFNINLQEDIPTLLASIQLSDKVNSKIQERVQQHLLQRQQPPSAAPTVRTAP